MSNVTIEELDIRRLEIAAADQGSAIHQAIQTAELLHGPLDHELRGIGRGSLAGGVVRWRLFARHRQHAHHHNDASHKHPQFAGQTLAASLCSCQSPVNILAS